MQVPYRSEWHPGERVWNGLQTGQCKFAPGPEISPKPDGEICCYPWVRTQALKCGLLDPHVELNYAMTVRMFLAFHRLLVFLRPGGRESGVGGCGGPTT